MCTNRVLILIALLVFSIPPNTTSQTPGGFDWSKATVVPDFTLPYRGVKPVTGEIPLLVILLGPVESEVSEQINVYSLGKDGYIGQSIVGVDEEKFTGWRYLPNQIPMPKNKTFKSAPAVLNSPDGNLQSVFALGVDGYVYQTVHSSIHTQADWNNWTPWSPLPQTRKFQSAPAAMNSPDGGLASAFALGEDGYIYQSVFTRGPGNRWHDWFVLPQTRKFKSAPAVMNSPDGSLASAFALGVDGYIYQSVYKRGSGSRWHDWTPLPQSRKFKSAPAVMNSSDGSLASVFALGEDGYIYQCMYSRGPGGHWNNWFPLSQTRKFITAPSVINSPDGKLVNVFAVGEDDRCYKLTYKRGPGSHWTSWTPLPGDWRYASAPAAKHRLIHKRSSEYYRQMIFGASQSVRSLFLENSYGKFTMKEAFVTPWLRAQDDPNTSEWDESSIEYIHGYPHLAKKSAWVIQQVEKMTSFRFKNFDSNQDGKITTDELCILWIYPGGGDARMRGTDPAVVPVPSLSQGVATHSLIRGGGGMSVATIAHELGHQALGLPDMYADGTNPGVDQYSLMGDKYPAMGTHFDPFSKIKLGWLQPTVVTKSGWYTIPDVERQPAAYILYNPKRGGKDYFIVENRWPGTPHESVLSDTGLAIWRIDEGYTQGDWGRHTIHLLRSGGPGANMENALWDGAETQSSYALGPNSSPANTNWRDGSASGIVIKNFSKAGSTTTVYFEIPEK